MSDQCSSRSAGWVSLVTATAAILVLSGCIGCADADEGDEEDDQPPHVSLECEERGFPCDYASSDPEALERATDYLEQVADRWREGETLPELVRWLVDQPGVVEVWSANAGFRLRVEDAAPVWFVDDGFAGPLPDADEGLRENLQRSVVAAHEEKESDKSVLLLQPFEDFPSLEGKWVSYVDKARDYPSSVDVRRGDDADWQSFGQFDEYDVIIVNTHGTTLCEVASEECETEDTSNWFACRSATDGEIPSASSVGPTLNGRRCEAGMFSGTRLSDCSGASIEHLPPGIYCAFHGSTKELVSHEHEPSGYECKKPVGEYRAIISSEYFRHRYRAAEQNKFFHFAACQLMATTAIPDALGSENAFFGWTDAVRHSTSLRVTSSILELAFGQGMTSSDLRQQIGDEAHEFEYAHPFSDYEGEPPLCSDLDDDGYRDQSLERERKYARTMFRSDLYHHAPTPDLRVRELVHVYPRDGVAPYGNGSRMRALPRGDETLIEIEIQLENIDEFEGDLSFELQPFDVELELDEREPLDEERGVWLVPATAVLDEVVEEDTPAELRVVQGLAEGGHTRHFADVTVAPLGPCSWEIEFGANRYSGSYLVARNDGDLTALHIGQDAQMSDDDIGGMVGIYAPYGTTGAVPATVSLSIEGDVWVADENDSTITLQHHDADRIAGVLRGRIWRLMDETNEFPFTGEVRWTADADCSFDFVSP